MWCGHNRSDCNIHWRHYQKKFSTYYYNMLDLDAINAYIIYEEFTGQMKISIGTFIQSSTEGLCQNYISDKT